MKVSKGLCINFLALTCVVVPVRAMYREALKNIDFIHVDGREYGIRDRAYQTIFYGQIRRKFHIKFELNQRMHGGRMQQRCVDAMHERKDVDVFNNPLLEFHGRYSDDGVGECSSRKMILGVNELILSCNFFRRPYDVSVVPVEDCDLLGSKYQIYFNGKYNMFAAVVPEGKDSGSGNSCSIVIGTIMPYAIIKKVYTFSPEESSSFEDIILHNGEEITIVCGGSRAIRLVPYIPTSFFKRVTQRNGSRVLSKNCDIFFRFK